MSNSSEVKLKQNVGDPRMRRSGCDRTAAFMRSAAEKISRACSRYPARPYPTIAAQVAASSPPEREPGMLGDMYLPPLQPARWKYCALRRLLSRKSSVDVPLKE